MKKRSLRSDRDKPKRSSFGGHRVLDQASPQECAAGNKLVLQAPGPRTARGRPVQVKSDVPLQGRRLMETAQAAVGPVSRPHPTCLPLSSPLTRVESPLVPARGPCLSWTLAERERAKHFDRTLTFYTKDTSLSTCSESSAQILRKPLRR